MGKLSEECHQKIKKPIAFLIDSFNQMLAVGCGISLLSLEKLYKK